MSSYAPIDGDLRTWAAEKTFHLATEYKDCEVRSFEVATRFGSVQIWVEPQLNGGFEVVACNNWPGSARRLERVPVLDAKIVPALDDLLRRIHVWNWQSVEEETTFISPKCPTVTTDRR